ncbi:hypothetical protein BDK51DRAFT_33459 [Blyttiomyces helicus]|uniref:Uncharacterized protein n=1 Tax=Blyttiomyces helicus TaxID=388810 RepID=A0A4P9VYX5_9FUNG|nr:hypothetical protein BDK51DRAFT_33459 [Blyttiomyces helicus]|eukprot:RKO83540.1 hypothetical protein BDK51DRAFT_33459 [Blyttiomyces helicus]
MCDCRGWMCPLLREEVPPGPQAKDPAHRVLRSGTSPQAALTSDCWRTLNKIVPGQNEKRTKQTWHGVKSPAWVKPNTDFSQEPSGGSCEQVSCYDAPVGDYNCSLSSNSGTLAVFGTSHRVTPSKSLQKQGKCMRWFLFEVWIEVRAVSEETSEGVEEDHRISKENKKKKSTLERSSLLSYELLSGVDPQDDCLQAPRQALRLESIKRRSILKRSYYLMSEDVEERSW